LNGAARKFHMIKTDLKMIPISSSAAVPHTWWSAFS